MERAKIFFIEMINENYLSLKKIKRDNLDSSYSKVKLMLFFPPLEGGSKGGGLI